MPTTGDALRKRVAEREAARSAVTAERIHTRQLKIEFAEMKARLNALAKELGDESFESSTRRTIGPPGSFSLDLDEDALRRTFLRGPDDRVVLVAWNDREAVRSFGVPERGREHAVALLHVRQAIDEHEDLGRYLDAQPAADAEVVIDPHLHDVLRRRW